MGVTVGTYGATDATGWTVFTNPTTVIYVSDSLGSDTTLDGTAPTNIGGGHGPFQTSLKAYNTAAGLGNGVSRWILFRRGDTFTGQSLTNDVNGDNDLYGGTNDPFVFSNYDDTIAVNTTTGAGVNPAASAQNRPIFIPTQGNGSYSTAGGTATSGGDWTAIVGIKFYNIWNDPNGGSFTGNHNASALSSFSNPLTWSLVEDCDIGFYDVGIDGFTIQRRNVVHDNAASGIHGPGAQNCIFEEMAIIGNATGAAGTIHNYYLDGVVRKGELASNQHGMILRGNTMNDEFSNADQFRSGNLIQDNCFLAEPGGTNFGMPVPGVENNFINNVFLEGTSNAFGATASIIDGQRPYGGSGAFNVGTLVVSGNIATNSVDATASGMNFDMGMNGITFSNNIWYKWGPSSPPPDNTIISYSGSLGNGGLTISNAGSGYTAKSSNISAASRETASLRVPPNNVILTIGSVADLNSNDGGASGATSVYISGISDGGGTDGGFAAALNGHVWKAAVKNAAANQIVLFETESVPGTYASGGAIYSPYRHQALTNVTVTNGNAGGATVDIMIGPSGTVVGFDYAGSEGPLAGDNFNVAGALYTVGDTVKSNDLNTNAHGGTDGGLLLTINAVAVNTITGASLSVNGTTGLITPTGTTSNIFDPTGTYIDAHPALFPAPSRTSGSYNGSFLGGTATRAAYIANLRTLAKNNWHPEWTANNGINPYIRAGFGIGGGGGASVPLAAPGTGNKFGVFRSPPRKIPQS